MIVVKAGREAEQEHLSTQAETILHSDCWQQTIPDAKGSVTAKSQFHWEKDLYYAIVQKIKNKNNNREAPF